MARDSLNAFWVFLHFWNYILSARVCWRSKYGLLYSSVRLVLVTMLSTSMLVLFLAEKFHNSLTGRLILHMAIPMIGNRNTSFFIL